MAEVFIDNAKVMAKGQVTIPKKIRDILEIENEEAILDALKCFKMIKDDF